MTYYEKIIIIGKKITAVCLFISRTPYTAHCLFAYCFNVLNLLPTSCLTSRVQLYAPVHAVSQAVHESNQFIFTG